MTIKGWYAFYISFVASIGGFLLGYDMAIISGAQIFLRDQFALSPQQFGFATSSVSLGCIAGPFLGRGLPIVLAENPRCTSPRVSLL